MLCLYCNAPLVRYPFQEPVVQSLFDACPWCSTPYSYTEQERRYLTQCCVCGVFLSGPYRGAVRESKGVPSLMQVISHGMCHACKERTITVWREQRLTRRRAA